MTQPIFRLFKLSLNLAYEADYEKVGFTNLTRSVAGESGTLAMFSNHVAGDKTQQVVLELYVDETSYQAHVTSEHFKAFANLAGKALTNREIINLEPQTLLKKAGSLRVVEKNDLFIRLAHVLVSDSQSFADIVLPEMKNSMAVEDGVLLMFAGTDINIPCSWYFYEIYANQAAYDSHCQTEHFKDYIARTIDLVVEKNLKVLTGDVLVSKADLS
ncbi:putative quinol monooxygenase [Streptococcus dentapri]|uniref:Quinol monooxygenase n=1 Tax=Streptococcus dentapri TaxID=573564 RepID=A0ABV8D223_9STRE